MSLTDTSAEPGIFAELLTRLDMHYGALGKMARQLAQPPAQPVFGRHAKSGVADTNGLAVLSIGGPTQGFFWYVRNLVVGGLSPAIAAAGTADVYAIAGGTPTIAGGVAGLGLGDWRDRAAALPSVAYYGRGEVSLRMNERLYVVVTGGTASQVYVAAASFEEYEEAPSKQGWST